MDLLPQVAVFLAAAVIAVPLFRRFKLGSVLGYLAAALHLSGSESRMLAAGTLHNNAGSLAGWIQNPQKPEAGKPHAGHATEQYSNRPGRRVPRKLEVTPDTGPCTTGVFLYG